MQNTGRPTGKGIRGMCPHCHLPRTEHARGCPRATTGRMVLPLDSDLAGMKAKEPPKLFATVGEIAAYQIAERAAMDALRAVRDRQRSPAVINPPEAPASPCPFAIDARVRCVDDWPDTLLQAGKVYTVERIALGERAIGLRELGGLWRWERFKAESVEVKPQATITAPRLAADDADWLKRAALKVRENIARQLDRETAEALSKVQRNRFAVDFNERFAAPPTPVAPALLERARAVARGVHTDIRVEADSRFGSPRLVMTFSVCSKMARHELALDAVAYSADFDADVVSGAEKLMAFLNVAPLRRQPVVHNHFVSTPSTERGTGRTFKQVAQAVALARQGKHVAYVVHTAAMARHVMGMLGDHFREGAERVAEYTVTYADRLLGSLQVMVVRSEYDHERLRGREHVIWDHASGGPRS